MNPRETSLISMAENLGAWLFIAGTVTVGVVGFVIWLGLAYAMSFSNLALGIVCVLLLSSPLIFGAAWVTILASAHISERSAEREALPSEAESR